MIKRINNVARSMLFYICHPRMFLSGVQSCVSGFPIKTFGNDNSFPLGGDRRSTRGQTALILILLAAAALIFLAIALNWGRVAQTKVLLSIAADQGTSLLASDAASYGEMEKQTYLKDKNRLTESTGIFLLLITVVIAIAAAVFAFFFLGPIMFALALVSVVMSIANLVLQIVVVQPMITSMWNSLQKDQPVTQQFFEGGIVSALSGSVTDRVSITDYLDWNANGRFGTIPPVDTVSRFAVFYTERLKMLHRVSPISPQVAFYYDQLGEFLNGETCVLNEKDAAAYPDLIAVNDYCRSINSDLQYCVKNPNDLACLQKIPGVFQLNDACTGSDSSKPDTYSPYCDPCCQPLTFDGAPLRPATCDSDTTYYGAPKQCTLNNPYGTYGSLITYTLLYDPAFQNYAKYLSFLDLFGRDQQLATTTTPSPGSFLPMKPNVITPGATATSSPIVEFPNGVFPFFWLTNAYHLEVDNMDPDSSLVPGQYHWCKAGSSSFSGPVPSQPAPVGFPDLAQLALGYTCSGKDCCTGWLADTVVSGIPSPDTNSRAIDMVGSPSFTANPYPPGNPGLDPSFGGLPTPSDTWAPGDNQMCSTTWTYNGSSAGPPDGTCEFGYFPGFWPHSISGFGKDTPATVDKLDSTMQALSDFVKFSNIFLSHDVETLSSSFQSWYPQVADWIAPCDDGTPCSSDNLQCADGSSCGRLLSIYNPYTSPAMDLLGSWNGVITSWLNNTYVDDKAWCVPQETTLRNDSGSCVQTSSCSSSGQCPDGSACTYAPDDYRCKATGKATSDCPSSGTCGGVVPGIPCDSSSGFWCRDGSTCQGICKDGTTKCTAGKADACIDTGTCTRYGYCVDGASDLCLWGSSSCSSASTCNFSSGLCPDGKTPCGAEDIAINNSGAPWGSLPSVNACLIYNNGTPAANFGQCLTALDPGNTCFYLPVYEPPTTASCQASVLGRSLTGQPAPSFTPSTTITCTSNIPCTCTACDCCWTGKPSKYVCDCAACGSHTYPSSASLSTTHPVPCDGTQDSCVAAGCPNGKTDCVDKVVCGKTGHLIAAPAECSSLNDSFTFCVDVGAATMTGYVNESPSCQVTQTGSFSKWVSDSNILAGGEQPKFAQRSAYLTDVYNRGQALPPVFNQGSMALQSFLKPCASTDTACQSGGPAAQLAYAGSVPPPSAAFPNSVIYGWQDDLPQGGFAGCTDATGTNTVGCSHIVKVTAYSPGRNKGTPAADKLPWIKTTTKNFGPLPISRSYTLTQRDGPVYVGIRRWDQDQSPMNFPNGRTLWQNFYHNPVVGGDTSRIGLPLECLPWHTDIGVRIGFGLLPPTIKGLESCPPGMPCPLPDKKLISPKDQTSLGQAFMLNDPGDGSIDINLTTDLIGDYSTCLKKVNELLGCGTESHMCAEYVASLNASECPGGGVDCSGTGSQDYSLKFFSSGCGVQPEDIGNSTKCSP